MFMYSNWQLGYYMYKERSANKKGIAKKKESKNWKKNDKKYCCRRRSTSIRQTNTNDRV